MYLAIWVFGPYIQRSLSKLTQASWHKEADTSKLTKAKRELTQAGNFRTKKFKIRNFKTGKFKTKSDRWVITESSLRHPWVIPGSSLGHPWVIPESCTTMGIREKLEFEVFKVIYYSHSGRFLNIFNQNFKKSIMDFENFKKFQIRLPLLHSDAFWLFLVHWGLDKPLLKIQGGHIK